MSEKPVAVVTGANRGIGREVARQLATLGWEVVLTARDGTKARATAGELNEILAGNPVHGHALDVTEPQQAAELAEVVGDRFGRLDALVNNAGVMFDDPVRSGVLEADLRVFRRTFETNTLGAFNVTRALARLLLRNGGGNLVNVSSGMGGIQEMGAGYPAYRLSKAALNALTRVLHAELNPSGVRVNAVCPGWVQTDMGGPNATRDLASGAAGVVWAATLEPDGPSGNFYRDGTLIPW
ncbi:MAG: SDR family NAD(P)-dependent oxidoreductase [Alphaproteobacteria bacterium]|nr:SDR family NAD(P)-dependent oxidoreductase [Alphaproteobacteria bacterium]MCB9693071.1 SDR family NAD(P)-dependent oxidoreductase [Alphaproteobacteria bacterium]